MSDVIGQGQGTKSFRSEDSAILEMSTQLCQQLGLTSLRPMAGFWVEKMPSDQCWVTARNKLFLPLGLRTRIELREWEPLLASSLVHFSKVSKRMFLVSVLSIASLVLLAPLSIFFIPFTLFQVQGIVAFASILFFASLYALWIFYGLDIVAQFYEKPALEADLEASKILGRNALLDVLMKINDFGLEDVEKRKQHRWIKPYFGWPSVTKRIANLQWHG